MINRKNNIIPVNKSNFTIMPLKTKVKRKNLENYIWMPIGEGKRLLNYYIEHYYELYDALEGPHIDGIVRFFGGLMDICVLIDEISFFIKLVNNI